MHRNLKKERKKHKKKHKDIGIKFELEEGRRKMVNGKTEATPDGEEGEGRGEEVDGLVEGFREDQVLQRVWEVVHWGVVIPASRKVEVGETGGKVVDL